LEILLRLSLLLKITKAFVFAASGRGDEAIISTSVAVWSNNSAEVPKSFEGTERYGSLKKI
jgi:hypothetical protein